MCYLSLEISNSFFFRRRIMKHVFLFVVAALLFSTAVLSQTPAVPSTHLKVGDKAPEFELKDTTGNPVKLSEFRGKKNVILAFYVLAFTGG